MYTVFGNFEYLYSLDSPEKNCNIYILSAENFIFINFFAVKVDGSDVNPGICLYKNLFPGPWVDVTSINFISRNVYEDEIFSQQDIHVLQFFSGESKEYKYSSPTQTV